MSQTATPDYERMYHLLNRRRGAELKRLERVGALLTDGYHRILRRDTVFSGGTSWERDMLIHALVELARLVDSFKEADAQVDDCAAATAETRVDTTWELVHGRESLHPDQ